MEAVEQGRQVMPFREYCDVSNMGQSLQPLQR